MANEIHHGEMYRPGMALPAYRFGVMNAEMFIAAVKTGNSDYTKGNARRSTESPPKSSTRP